MRERLIAVSAVPQDFPEAISWCSRLHSEHYSNHHQYLQALGDLLALPVALLLSLEQVLLPEDHIRWAARDTAGQGVV